MLCEVHCSLYNKILYVPRLNIDPGGEWWGKKRGGRGSVQDCGILNGSVSSSTYVLLPWQSRLAWNCGTMHCNVSQKPAQCLASLRISMDNIVRQCTA